MKQFHYSTAQCFNQCPKRFDLTYRQGLTTLPSDDPANALILGTAIHRAMETDLETAVREYLFSYPVTTTEHYNEVIKMEHWIPKLKELIPDGLHEVPFENDVYKGTADLLVPIKDKNNWFDLYDFKYSNNIDSYMDSEQLHVYKRYLQEIKGIWIRRMFFVFIPKVQVRQGKTETMYQFRKRLQDELDSRHIEIREVIFNQKKVDAFHHTCMKIGLTETCEPTHSYLCDWCEFKLYCKEGKDYMILPSAERRDITKVTKRKLFIYGRPTSGKTVFLDKSPDPLNLNTDGNIQFVTMQYIPIKDTMEGRQKIPAWKVFKDTVDELERTAESNGFKTIIIDLVEDLYESCRLFMYSQLGITHESDDSFRAWDKVRTEFLSTIRRFMNLDYENIILVSQEDATKDIMKKSGDKITAIKPNIPDKIATKLAGMVDIVARVVAEDDGSRTLNFKADEVIFGGGRLNNMTVTKIPLDWNELMKVYSEATEGANSAIIAEPKEEPTEEEKPSRRGRKQRTEEDNKVYLELPDGSVHMSENPAEVETLINDGAEPISKEEFDQGLVDGRGQVAKQVEEKKTRRRRKKEELEPAEEKPVQVDMEPVEEEAPKRRRTRKARS